MEWKIIIYIKFKKYFYFLFKIQGFLTRFIVLATLVWDASRLYSSVVIIARISSYLENYENDEDDEIIIEYRTPELSDSESES